MRCIGGIGASAAGPLRLVNTADIRLEVKRHQQYSPIEVRAAVQLYMPADCADLVEASVRRAANRRDALVRGSWLLMTPAELAATVRHELAALAPGVKALTPAERLEAAERWLDKRWG